LAFGLLLWDGYRPQCAVDSFHALVLNSSEDGRTEATALSEYRQGRDDSKKGYVAAKSGHSRGSTVDLTLYHFGFR